MAYSTEYFYNSRGDKIPTAQVDQAKQELKGTTMDGHDVYHTTFFDARRHKHISYDTVVYRGEHCYILGSGHETNHGSSDIIPWDIGNRVTWQEALRRHTSDLIRT